LILIASGDVLEDFVLLYAKYIPNIQVLRARTPQKGGSYRFFLETLGGLYGSAKRRGELVDACAMGSFKTYALIPCLFSNDQG
jgi:hypothetical protein